ncbi:MAG: arylsulfatase [Verrucomicrobia bacterium]|nr:arylsulfatase [Verrucomicrobiota bacterium]
MNAIKFFRIQSVSIFLLFSLLLGCSKKEVVEETPLPNPNIILIYTDDQGYGDASNLNPGAKFKTPALDRLAAEGLTFTDGHCSDTVCTPSRYGLLTGRYSWRTHLKRGVFTAEKPCLIEDGRMTLASLLGDNGYDTAMVGKWHLGMDFPGTPKDRDWSQPVQDMPLDKGFDYFYGVPASLNYGILAWFEGRYAAVPPTVFTAKKPNDRHMDYRIMPPYQNTPEETKEVVGTQGMEVAPDFIDNQCLTRFTDKAIEWITDQTQAEASKPFFMYLPFTSPHYPVCPLPEFWGQGEAGGYGEFMIETDYHVGRILDFLDKRGLAENTLVIFTSDNGPERSWEQRIEEFDHDSSHIYREGKRSIYEGGHRVPFYMRWPARIPAGQSYNHPVGQTDLLATFADILGVALPDEAGEDSVSLLPALDNPSINLNRAPIINHAMNGRYAIREGDWKLILPNGDNQRELYNLSDDPGEETNIFGQQPGIEKQLEERITTIVKNGRTTSGAPQSNDVPWWPDLTWISN